MDQGESTMFSGVTVGEGFNKSHHDELAIVAHTAPMKSKAMSFSADCGRGTVDCNSAWLLSAGHSGELV